MDKKDLKLNKIYFLVIIMGASIGASFAKDIPQTTSYGAYLRFGSVGSSTSLLSIVPKIRQPIGDNAFELYADILDIPEYFGLGGQYYYSVHNLFPIRVGDLVAQYGPGFGIGLGSNYFDFGLEPAAGVVYYFEKEPTHKINNT